MFFRQWLGLVAVLVAAKLLHSNYLECESLIWAEKCVQQFAAGGRFVWWRIVRGILVFWFQLKTFVMVDSSFVLDSFQLFHAYNQVSSLVCWACEDSSIFISFKLKSLKNGSVLLLNLRNFRMKLQPIQKRFRNTGKWNCYVVKLFKFQF